MPTTTLKAIRRYMLTLDPSLGEQHAITSLTTTTTVCASLAYGTMNAGRYVGKWMVRADATNSADRTRAISNFAASTGTLTHAGTNYADTTATSEIVEILHHYPAMYDNAINLAVRQIRYSHRDIAPSRADGVLSLSNFPWIQSPGDIRKISWNNSAVLSRNRFFRDWPNVSTAGALQADAWTLAGSGATYSRSSTQTWRDSPYSAALVRAGTDCTLSQTVSLLDTGIADQSLRGRTVTVAGRLWASVASRARLSVSDGITTTTTSYHSGGSGWEELSAEHTIAATATSLTIAVELNDGDTTIYGGEAFLCLGSLTDNVRAGGGQVAELRRPDQWDWDQHSSHVAVRTARGIGQSYLIESDRPYPGFDALRVAAGTADADVSDVPVATAAAGGIANLYAGMAEEDGQDGMRYRALGQKWKREFERMALRHIGRETPSGVDFGLSSLAPPARRI